MRIEHPPPESRTAARGATRNGGNRSLSNDILTADTPIFQAPDVADAALVIRHRLKPAERLRRATAYCLSLDATEAEWLADVVNAEVSAWRFGPVEAERRRQLDAVARHFRQNGVRRHTFGKREAR